MEYKGYTICHSPIRGWFVRVNIWEEWLASSKEDAMNMIDKRLSKSLNKAA